MFPHERRLKILELIRKNGTVSVAELCKTFSVSAMTIRRDLRRLEHESLVEQIYGGAAMPGGTGYEPPFPSRQTERVEQKAAIGRKAAELVNDGDTVALDVGTTTLELARNLRGKKGIVVVTASTQIALELVGYEGINVIIAGGVIRPKELSVVGDIAVDTFKRFFVDKAFLGAAGVTLEQGVSDYNTEDTNVKRTIISRAKETILLVDSRKVGKVAFAWVCPADNLRAIVTDWEVDRDCIPRFERQGVKVLVAEATAADLPGKIDDSPGDSETIKRIE